MLSLSNEMQLQELAKSRPTIRCSRPRVRRDLQLIGYGLGILKNRSWDERGG